MFLTGAACALPSRRVFNDEILELVSYYSRPIYSSDLRALLSSIEAKLRRIGINSRYWRAPKERPISLLQHACEIALRQSRLTVSDVDYVIYVGVDRGFAEPANACFVARELGMDSVRTFDVADACLGWSTATEVAQALFASNPRADVALLVSAEFPMRPTGAVVPACFQIASDSELEWKFPAFTLGEAATATVLVNEGPPWRFIHETHNELADLCTVGLGPPSEYARPSPRFDDSDSCGFRAYGNDLGRHVYRPAVRVLRDLLKLSSKPRVVFPHSVVGPYIDQVVSRVSTGLQVFSTFAEMGNLATSSLPSCIVRGRQRGVIDNDDVAIGWAAASGLKVSAFEIGLSLGRDEIR